MTLAKPRHRLNAASGRPLPWLWYMTDQARQPDPRATAAKLSRGVGVIFRHYDHPRRADLAAALARLCRRRGLILLIANDRRLARAVGADGVHFAEWMGRRQRAPLDRPERDWLVSMAVHSAAAVDRANRLEVDFVLASPVFPTRSHPDARTLGLVGLGRLCRRARCPVYALGGATLMNWPDLRQVGAAGLAGIGLFA